MDFEIPSLLPLSILSCPLSITDYGRYPPSTVYLCLFNRFLPFKNSSGMLPSGYQICIIDFVLSIFFLGLTSYFKLSILCNRYYFLRISIFGGTCSLIYSPYISFFFIYSLIFCFFSFSRSSILWCADGSSNSSLGLYGIFAKCCSYSVTIFLRISSPRSTYFFLSSP